MYIYDSGDMFSFTYYKIAGRWYLDNPAYLENGGRPEDLERVGSLYDLLERAAQGGLPICLQLDTVPFQGVEEAVLVGSSGDQTGVYYLIRTINGQRVDLEIWVNEFIYHYHAEPPPRIYGKFIL